MKNGIEIVQSSVASDDVMLESEIAAIQEAEVGDRRASTTSLAAVMPWPTRGELSIDERHPCMLLASSFPVLFPCGAGDVTYKVGRKREVTFNGALTLR